MRMVKWFLLLAVVVSSTGWAEVALNKAVLEEYFALAPKLEALSEKYPELEELEEQVFIFEDHGRTFTRHLAESDAYDELNAKAKMHGFESVDDFVNVSVRLFAALYAVQMAGLPEEDIPSVKEQRKQLREQAEQLKSFGMTDEMVAQTLGSVSRMIDQQEQIALAATKVSAADKKVVQEHSDWIMEQLDVMEETLDPVPEYEVEPELEHEHESDLSQE